MKKQTTHKTIDLPNGETYAYREAGNPKNPTMLMLHGYLTTSRVFERNFIHFQDKLHLVAPDFRGHALSSYKNPIRTIKDYADDIKMFCDALGLKKVILLGWSLGGAVSMQFTALYPEYVERIILKNSASCAGIKTPQIDKDFKILPDRVKTLEDVQKRSLATLLNMLVKNNFKDRLETVFKNIVYDETIMVGELLEMFQESIAQCRAITDTNWALNIFNISGSHNGLVEGTNEISKIRCPVLLLVGDHDTVTPSAHIFNKKGLGDLAKVIIYKDTGHTIIEERKSEFIKVVKEFVESKQIPKPSL